MNAKHKGGAQLWLLNVVGNAALLAAVYFWLLLPDAHGWQVAGSGLVALVVIFFALWLRTGSFAYFRVAEFRETAAVGRAFRHSLRHMIALALWFIPFAVLIWWVFSLQKYAPQFGVWIWQKVPLLRIGSPRLIFHLADGLLWIVLILFVAFWLPVASTVAAAGFNITRMARSLRVLRRVPYWGWFFVLVVIGAYIPCKLIWWIPALSDLRHQAWSMGLRFGVAYLILVSAFVALLLVIGEKVEQEDPEPVPLAPPSSH
jgi:hypothetical protein